MHRLEWIKSPFNYLLKQEVRSYTYYRFFGCLNVTQFSVLAYIYFSVKSIMQSSISVQVYR